MIDLVAKLRLKDDMTNPLKRLTKNLESTNKTVSKVEQGMSRMERRKRSATSATTGLSNSVYGLGGKMSGLVSKLNPVALGLAAIGTAAAGAYGAVKVFNATVGEAMKMQQSQVVIGAMFDNNALSSQYMKMMDRIAIDSPLLDSQAMYANSKSFISTSKDLGQLEQMWSLAERLVALDPIQGVEGAIFALKELFSGDAISIVERFELPRSVMKDIKNLPLERQLVELDKYFNSIGASTNLIDKMGGTALGMWTQVKERFALVLRDMGEPSLKAVSNFLNEALKRLEGAPMQKFAEWGGRAIESVVSGLSNNAVKIYDYFTNLSNNPEFQSRSTLTGKISFIVEDIADKLDEWYSGGGQQKLTEFTSKVTEVIIGTLNNSTKFFQLGNDLGKSLSDGIIEGVKNAALETRLGQFLKFSFVGGDNYDKAMERLNARTSSVKTANEQARHSNYHGLDNVPYDGYSTRLHRGERVMTAQENREYSKGGNSVTIAKLADQIIVREEADVKKIAYELAVEIERRRM